MTIRKKTVTITVDGKKWERFKKISKIKNRNASQLIRDYIDKYLSENSQTNIEEFLSEK